MMTVCAGGADDDGGLGERGVAGETEPLGW